MARTDRLIVTPEEDAQDRRPRDSYGRFMAAGNSMPPPPLTAEVATLQQAMFLGPMALPEYPNPSDVIRYRSNGQYLRYYKMMLSTDPDLKAAFTTTYKAVIRNPLYIRPASKDPVHLEHAKFVRFAFSKIRNLRAAMMHFLTAHAVGFTPSEKIYDYVNQGEYKGAVVIRQILDKPPEWFGFNLHRELCFRTIRNVMPGIVVDPVKFIVARWGSSENPWGDATLNDLFWVHKIKQQLQRLHAYFLEGWAMPRLKGAYPYMPGTDPKATAANEKARGELLSVLANYVRSGSAVFPEGYVVELLESTRQGSVSFESAIALATATEFLLVTGQTLSNLQGKSSGSYSQSKTHDRHGVDTEVGLGEWLDADVLGQQIVEDLVDRNFGPPDLYPTAEHLALSAEDRQAELEIVLMEQAAGLDPSEAWIEKLIKFVPSEGPDDKLIQSPTAIPQPLPISPGLASEDEDSGLGAERQKYVFLSECVKTARERRRTGAGPAIDVSLSTGDKKANLKLYNSSRRQAAASHAAAKETAAAGAKQATPALKKIVSGLIAPAKSTGRPAMLTAGTMAKALRKVDVTPLAGIFGSMLGKAANLASQDSGGPPDVPDGSKAATALEVLALLDALEAAGSGAGDSGKTVDQFFSDLTSPAAAGPLQTAGNKFNNVHLTNIYSIRAAEFFDQLQDPAFRAANPYVQIVHPDAENAGRIQHKILDGWIVSSDVAAKDPSLLPPYGFGDPMQAIPISADAARTAGLTGAYPLGDLDTWLKSMGATEGPLGWSLNGERFSPGNDYGFRPASVGVDTQSSIAAIRQKAEQLRRQDPYAWADFQQWLLWLFGYDVLTQNSKEENNGS